VNKLEQEAKDFLAKKKNNTNDKILADIKSTIALLESCQIKLNDIVRVLLKINR
tara:strand:- start:4346 stop:4507 length:162 start_codon:yes stop_codon:yes gene_type:complete